MQNKTYTLLYIVISLIIVFAGVWLLSTRSAANQSPELTSALDYASPDQGTDTTSDQVTTPTATTTQKVTTTIKKQNFMSATLHTNQGDITITFDSKLAPNAVANFEKLAGSNFYDGVKFHRVIKGFMDQAGDPLTKDDSQMARWGTGGPGYMFADEITPDSKNDLGAVSMANSGPDTNGSQFYINAANNNFLDGKYTVFGHVTGGMDVVMAINATPTDSSDRPITPVIIQSVTLH